MSFLAPYFAEGTLGEVAAIGTTALGITDLAYQGTSRMSNQITPAKRLRSGRTYSPSATMMPASTMAPTAGLHTSTRRSAYRRNLGRKPGKYATRRTSLAAVLINNVEDKRTYFSRLINVQWSANADEINRRRGAIANVHGVKLRYWFKLKNSAAQIESPIQVRWAIVNPKNNSGADLSGTVAPVDFFIQKDPVNEQAGNFPTTGFSFDYHNRKINRNEWGVVKEGTFILGAAPSIQAAAGAPAVLAPTSYKNLSIYIPIKRQMKWNNVLAGSANGYPEENLYFVYWFTRLGDNIAGKQYTAATTPLVQQHEFITYFSNAQMFK